jgi:ElaB/YqjD/DUF883 family membrane-anchored ribosome-binding protein
METKSQTWGSIGVTAKKENVSNALKSGENAASQTTEEIGNQVEEARSKLNSALESLKGTYAKAQEKTVAAARATDTAVRENLYQSIGIAFGIGLLIGVLVNYRSRD